MKAGWILCSTTAVQYHYHVFCATRLPADVGRAMMSGFEMMSMILTSCQTPSVRLSPSRQLQCDLPCCSAV